MMLEVVLTYLHRVSETELTYEFMGFFGVFQAVLGDVVHTFFLLFEQCLINTIRLCE